MRFFFAPWRLCVFAWMSGVVSADLPNLAPDPGAEAGPAAMPAGWEPVVAGPAAEFAADLAERHGGVRSFRLSASEVTRAYFRSDPIPVAPGEELRIEAWVRHRGVPEGQGAVILIADFGRDEEDEGDATKVGVAAWKEEWHKVAGVKVVPPGASSMRLRMGVSYSMGTVWWDDVVVRPAKPLAARFALEDGRLPPGGGAVPVEILNRDGRKGIVRVRVRIDGTASERRVDLTGKSLQRIEVPVRVEGRGDKKVAVELLAGDGKEILFSAEGDAKVPPPLVLQPPTPTHWVVEDGEPRLGGELEVALGAEERKTASLVVRLQDAAGVDVPQAHGPLRMPVPDGTVEFEWKLPEVPPGAYRLVAELTQGGGKALTAAQAWGVIPRAKARVTVNADGHLEAEGKVLFPLGMFNNVAKAEESAAAGFNVAHTYNAARVTPGARPDDRRLFDTMARVGQAGMRMLLLVPGRLAEAGDWDGFRRRIRMFRNHPALLAWDEEEGLARGDLKIDHLRRIRQILREEDPNHPFMVGDASDVVGRVRGKPEFFPAECMDLGMWWWYPFPLKVRAGDALQGEEAAPAMELQPPAFLGAGRGKPVWIGVQSYKKPGEGDRYPTPEEYRVQAYLGLIHGAKGLMWYGGSVTGGLYLSTEEGRWDELKKLVTEIRGMEDVFLAPAGPAPVVEPVTAPVSAALRLPSGRKILLAANRRPDPVEAVFLLPGLPDAEAKVRNENRTVRIEGGRLRDRFGPLDVHVYELP